MSTLRERIESSLLDRIEQLKEERGEDLPAELFEPLFDHLDEVVDIVAAVQNFSTEPYMDKVREVVCTRCLANADGHCARREAHLCGLNDYFPIIVATIEKVLKTDPGLEQ